MRVIILGALGEVGRSLSQSLIDRGHEVIPASSRAPLGHFPNMVSIDSVISRLKAGTADLVVNCAGRGDRRIADRTGTDATQLIAPLLSRSGIPGVLLSTTRVLEGYSGLVKEDAEPCPTSAYGQANSENERLWLDARAEGGQLSVLRLTNFFADPMASDSPQSLLLPWSLIQEAVAQRSITMRSGPNVSKDFIAADDVVAALEILARHSDAPKLCATAPGFQVTLSQLAEMCAVAVESLSLDSPKMSFGPDGEISSQLGAGWLSSKGWSCRLTTEAMIAVMVKWTAPRVGELKATSRA